MIEKLKHQLAGQNRHRFGVRSESLDQLNLTFEEDEEIAEAAEEQAKPAQPAPEDKPSRQHIASRCLTIWTGMTKFCPLVRTARAAAVS